ncbi:MAG: hypothetical protein KDI79_06045 [Anaerolineae bacterium]|nr:hypothetical protein [Anaerolineae bacterium]
MNEQEFADLFSDQIDRMLAGESLEGIPDIDDLPELLDVGQRISQTQFQPSTAAQTAFQSSLASWFGSMNGGSSMTILGLSKTWFFSIIIVAMVIITGTGFIALIATSVVIINTGDLPVVGTYQPTGTVVAGLPGDDDDEHHPTAVHTSTVTITPAMTLTITPPVTGTPTITSTAVSTTTPTTPVPSPSGTPHFPGGPGTGNLPPIIIVNKFPNINLCNGAYVTHSTLVNYSSAPAANAALVWEVIEGTEFVTKVDIISDKLDPPPTLQAKNIVPTPVPAGDQAPHRPIYFANMNAISVDQEVDLDINVDVGDSWWDQPDGTIIKVRIWIENRIEISDGEDYWDHNRGHGNDPDGYDEDNPGQGHASDNNDDLSTHSQIITIVKQGAKWVSLEGFIQEYGEQTYLIDGNIIIINECTSLPVNFIPGSKVKIIGWRQPDGTFIAINIIVINITIITGDFDNGVHVPINNGGNDDDDDGGGGSGGGGKAKGGDHDRGHGNDPDGHDEDNPGKGKGKKK